MKTHLHTSPIVVKISIIYRPDALLHDTKLYTRLTLHVAISIHIT